MLRSNGEPIKTMILSNQVKQVLVIYITAKSSNFTQQKLFCLENISFPLYKLISLPLKNTTLYFPVVVKLVLFDLQQNTVATENAYTVIYLSILFSLVQHKAKGY